MQYFSELNENKNLSIALGYFDGVHKGHQEVIKQAVSYAKQKTTKSAVITFKDHPCCYLWNVKPKYILTREERCRKIEELGVDYLYELDFKKIAHYNAQEYLENVIIKNFAPVGISTGFNHHFGQNKSGDTKFLNEMSKKYLYEYFMHSPVMLDDTIISSTHIRKLLTKGNIIEANKMLGYNFSLDGVIIEGQKLGRKIGYRTANILYPEEIIDLPHGAYKTQIYLDGKIFNAVTNIGIRPTISNSQDCIIESHILNFSDDIYGRKIKVKFIELIRKEHQFNNIEQLKEQIKKDIKYCNFEL